jgi:prophage DNA circulation protein
MSYTAPWRLALRPASFRNVPFQVKSAQTQVGRRVALHEYPQRDEAYPEDLGLKADQFTVEAFVLGPSYHQARDALIVALKQPGPGLLIHPYYGQRTVTLMPPARISETTDEGGIARFSLDFVEAGENAEPSAREDTQAAVESAADAANTAIAEDFALDFSVAGVQDFVESSALGMAGNVIGTLQSLQRGIVPNISVLSDFQATVSSVVGNLNKLIRAPAAYAQSVLGLVGTLKALAKSPLVALGSYRGMFSYGGSLPRVAGTTASRQRQAANQNAQSALLRRAALIEATRCCSRIEFSVPRTGGDSTPLPTYDQVVALRDDLAGRLDDEAAGIVPAPVGNGTPETMVVSVSDPVYQALTALRVALVRDIADRAIDAPRLASVTLPSTMPALVAAYRIHGDATRTDELIARNKAIRHPGFVPGGTPLEIVAD